MGRGWLAGTPDWLLAGVLLGIGFTVLIAVVFAIGARVLPDGARSPSSNGGEERRHIEIREYLHGIGEPFTENHEIGGRRVAFYLPERDVAITFDAQDYFVLDREGIEVVLVEYELPGMSIGHRLPFDAPDVPPDPESEPAVAFEILGLEPGASEAEVRSAYRNRIKNAHPDHGGDAETFERVREAYTVARERAE